MRRTQNATAFTLIELLIVVAIIAILAAIAVPNFLEAQVRSKIARVKADLRTVAIAVESYTVDHNKPPHSQLAADRHEGQYNRNGINMVTNLSTPVAYLSGVKQFIDPFCPKGYYDPELGTIPDDSSMGHSSIQRTAHMTYMNIYGWGQGWGFPPEGKRIAEAAGHWSSFVLISLGPDFLKGPNPFPQALNNTNAWYVGDYGRSSIGKKYAHFAPWHYDPSNGTNSKGDILRWQGN